MLLWNIYKKDIEIWYANSFKKYCYPIFVSLIVDYKEQIVITRIKSKI